MIKAYLTYVELELERVQSQYHEVLSRYFAQGSLQRVLMFINTLRAKSFNPANSRARKSDYKQQDRFTMTNTDAVLSQLKIVEKPSFPAAAAAAAYGPRFPAAGTAAYVPPSSRVHGGCSHRQFSINTGRGAYVYESLPVSANGDCGYTAFGIEREEAFTTIMKKMSDGEVLRLLKPVVREQLTNLAFINRACDSLAPLSSAQLKNAYSAYIDQQDGGVLLQAELETHGALKRLAEIYIEYDVQEKMIDGGWCHPVVLQVLAYIRGIHLRIWKEENGRAVPHKSGLIDYSNYCPSGASSCVDLLFTGGNHFERLERTHSEKKASSAKRRRSKIASHGDPVSVPEPAGGQCLRSSSARLFASPSAASGASNSLQSKRPRREGSTLVPSQAGGQTR